MLTMSFKRSTNPPARPPPPKGGMSLGGMSFKKLEQEEEEESEDLTISDKYTTLLQHVKASPSETLGSSTSAKSSTSSLSSMPSAKVADVSEAEDVSDKSSPQRKGLTSKSIFEYKEILSGLKGKIQEKITKKIEDFSGESRESSASTTPDKEHPAVPISSSSDARSSSGTNAPSDDLITKTMVGKLRSSLPELVKSTGVKESQSEPAALSAASARLGTEGPARPTSVPVRAVSEERQVAPALLLERHTSSVPMQLSALATGEAAVDGGQDMLVIEEHFHEEPFEDFAGGLTTSTLVHSRSKPKKAAPKTVATVSLSGLAKSQGPEGETGGAVQKTPSSATDPYGHDYPDAPKTSPLMRLVSHDGQSVPWSRVLTLVAGLFAYFIMPMPSFLSGLIAGCALASVACAVYLWLTQPPHVRQPLMLTPIEELPPMEVPEMKEPTQEDAAYKGWMNEIAVYNPEDYHINHTYSVFVTLEGTKLRLQRPKTPIPRRAMHDENISAPHFIHQRHFDLHGSHVVLQPPGLVKKRVWSKKYPLCICLARVGTKIHNKGDSSVDAQPLSSDSGFELISEEKCDSSLLYLFARTCREKEEWYKRFVAATKGAPLVNPVLEMRRSVEHHRQSHHKRVGSDGVTLMTNAGRQRHNSNESQSSAAPEPADNNAAETEAVDPLIDFTRYMGHLMPAGAFNRLLSPSKSKDSGTAASRLPFTGSIICDSQLYWLNALIGRCFYDFLRDRWWTEKVKDKLQRKLSKIHVPYFIEELKVTAIDMGKEMPVVRRASNPYLDEKGFWVDLDISYGGGFQMTIETKMNLMKLKRTPNPPPAAATQTQTSERSPVTDSDEEDSAESSTDEEEEMAASPEEKESGGGSRKLLKYLNKLTSTRYFQQATEYKYIKRAMETVSNTPLQLRVSLKHLVGKLAVNVPPPPSDRLWYGFRGSPRLWLVAKPQVGERVVTITHITDWIERKLEVEFQRVFVMPNMDDLVIPILRASQSSSQPDDDEEDASSL